jgi:hypothetical protein
MGREKYFPRHNREMERKIVRQNDRKNNKVNGIDQVFDHQQQQQHGKLSYKDPASTVIESCVTVVGTFEPNPVTRRYARRYAVESKGSAVLIC